MTTPIALTVGLVTRHFQNRAGGWDPAMLDIAQDHALCHLHEQGLFDLGLVFKGGTALRKCRAGATGRFSTAGSDCESGLTVVRLQVVLRNVTPEVRRVVDVPGDIGLPLLHLVLQEAVGWERAHLHQFISGSRRWSRPDLDGVLDETAATLRDLGPRFVYEYDFGDGWEHDVVLVGPGVAPGLVEGSGACPPEDCGGPWGFEELQQVLADPRHPEHADRLEWLGEPLLDYNHDRHAAQVAQLLA